MISPLPVITPINVVAPIVVAGLFIALVSLFKEPTRQKFSALMIAGAGFVYFGGSFRIWEIAYGALFLLSFAFGLSLCRSRLGSACDLGYSPPSLWAADPSIYSALFLWLRDL